MELLLVRHGITAQNAARVFMGYDPVPLSPKGREQVACLAERLRSVGIDRLVASDIARARESADILASAVGLPVEEAVALREIDVGDAKGLSYDAVAERWPDVFRPEGDGRFPRGESFAEVGERAARYLREEVIPGEEERVLVVCHGGVVRSAAARLLGLPLTNLAIFQVDNASITVLRAEGGAVGLVGWNDVAHLGDSHRATVGRLPGG